MQKAHENWLKAFDARHQNQCTRDGFLTFRSGFQYWKVLDDIIKYDESTALFHELREMPQVDKEFHLNHADALVV